MRGSRIAAQIIDEMNREKYFKQKAIRNQCVVDKKKKCSECKYKEICDDIEK